MNRTEQLFIILMEECAELQQSASKILRFGLKEGRDIKAIEYGNNLERLQGEYNDVLAVIDLINDTIFNDDFDILLLQRDIYLIRAKQEKVEKYLLYSKECGTMN